MLNAYPLPNFVDPDPKARLSCNYKDSAQSPYPKRQEICRTDINITRKLRFYYRGVVNSTSRRTTTATGRAAPPTSSWCRPSTACPAWGHVGSLTWTISPTFVSETSFGVDNNGIDLDMLDTAPVSAPSGAICRSGIPSTKWQAVRDPNLAPLTSCSADSPPILPACWAATFPGRTSAGTGRSSRT